MTLFKTRFDLVRNPRNAKTMKAIVLESPDWVNVVAVTPERKVVVVRQFRFGIGKITTEVPAGLVDAGEAHKQAALRELVEETGYTTDNWRYLGMAEGNPAFLNNLCHQWLALDAVKTHHPALDDGEDVWVGEFTLDELREEIRAGRMANSVTLLALMRVFDLRGQSEREMFEV